MELVVLSGKGGTGKTTIATALSELAKKVVRIDCDVDAPNLFMFYNGEDIERNNFYAGQVASLNEEQCIKCGKCEATCKFNAINEYIIDTFLCEGCGACKLICPTNAISLHEEKTAQTFITELDKGIISRAEMEIGSDGSGKLVTYLKNNGKRFNKDENLIIIDGSPGIGCPVIASITGSDAVLIVTEPTKSGLEDLKRVLTLCEFFGLFTMVTINKYDINLEMTNKIQEFIEEKSIKLVGKIPYDDIVIQSINELKPINYYQDSKAKEAIYKMWEEIKALTI